MNITHTSKRSRLPLAGVAGMVVVGALAVLIGRTSGEQRAAAHAESLQLLWPNLMELPQEDRALLVGLATTCNLERRSLRTDAVGACLRDGLRVEQPMLPTGLSKDEASARLDAMLAAAAVSQ